MPANTRIKSGGGLRDDLPEAHLEARAVEHQESHVQANNHDGKREHRPIERLQTLPQRRPVGREREAGQEHGCA